MMTPDKDFGQLVTDGVKIYHPGRKGTEVEIQGVEEINAKYGFTSPSQVIDLLALMGDAVDNIPGCPGVGEVTAKKLVHEFGSVENLLANTDKLKGALQRKVTENVEQIKFSKFLATIKTDVHHMGRGNAAAQACQHEGSESSVQRTGVPHSGSTHY